MEPVEPTAEPTHSSEEEDDPDWEDGDTVISRGWPRNHKTLVKHGFGPVWTR